MHIASIDWLGAAALGLFAYLASILGTEWAGLTNDIALVWAANGALLGALLRVPVKRWALYLIVFYGSQIAANLALGESWSLAAVYPFGDFVGTVLGAALLFYIFRHPLRLSTLREVLLLIIVGAGVGQAFGGVFGALVAYHAFGSEFLPTWLTWSVSGAVGIAFVTPVILTIERIALLRNRPPRELTEFFVILVLAAALSAYVAQETNVSLLYLVSPVLLWSALRFQVPGAALVNAFTATMVVFTSLDHIIGFAPVEEIGEITSALLSQLYLLVLFVPSLIAAALFEQLNASRNELTAAQVKYRDFAEVASDWQWTLDASLRFTELSPDFERATGLRTADTIGKRWEEIVQHIDSDGFQAYLEDLRQRRPFHNFHYWFETPTAELRMAEISGKPIFDADGGFAGYRGSGADITEKEEAEQRFKAMFENANIAMLVVGPDGSILLPNQKLTELLGYEKHELLSKTVIDITHPDDRAMTSDHLDRLSMGEVPSLGIEKRYQHKDGSTVWGFLSSAAVRRPEASQPLYFVSAIQDISIQVTQAQALQVSEERYRRAAKLGKIGHWIWDHIEDRCVYCSPELAEIFGVSVDEFLETTASLDSYVLDWVHPDDLADYSKCIHDAIDNNRGHETVVRVILKDKRIRYLHEFVEPAVDNTGKALQSFGVLTDITEERETEEALRQSQKLEAVGQLTGGIAHDLNNILGVVMGNLEISQRRIENEQVSILVDRAISAVQRGARLTHRLLVFARRQPLSPEVVNTGTLLQNMSDLLHRTLGEDVSIEIIVDGGLWLCRVDPNEFENVILNLAVNARHAMPQGGRLTIEVSNARLDHDYAERHSEIQPGQYVCLSATDTGTGMSAEVVEKAFDPFFTTKGPERGTGLGLSMAHGFVKQSGGHIKIYSELGEGTTVKVYLPRTRDKAEIQQMTPSIEPVLAGDGKVILLVEDDPELLTLINEYLVELGFRVIQASRAADAIEIFKEEPAIDLLLTDVILPGGMNGSELARVCEDAYPAVRVLFMSGYSKNAIMHQGRLDEGVELIQKPFSLTDLSKRLLLILSRNH